MKINARMCATLCAATFAAQIQAEARQPRWELGLGLGALTMADYVGSEQTQSYALPVPYVVYRGEHIRADRGGLRAMLFDSERLELKLSLSATPPVRDDGNHARQDMPDLDPNIEVGPELRWHIWQDASQRVRWDLRLPLRGVYAAGNGGLHGIGASVSPALSLELREAFSSGWKFAASAGPVFGDRDYHDYYYGVGQKYATEWRAAYAVDAGYGGLQLSASLTRRRGHWWTGVYLNLRNVRGATFEDSPLVQQSGSLQAGIGFAYIFAHSRELVTERDEF